MKNLTKKLFGAALFLGSLAGVSNESVAQNKELVESQKGNLNIEYSVENKDKDNFPEQVNSVLKYDGETFVNSTRFDTDNDNNYDSISHSSRFKSLAKTDSGLIYLGTLDVLIGGEEKFSFSNKDSLDYYKAALITEIQPSGYLNCEFKDKSAGFFGYGFERRFEDMLNASTKELPSGDSTYLTVEDYKNRSNVENFDNFLLKEFYNNSKVFKGRKSEFDAEIYSRPVVNSGCIPKP